jgi:hypothetical protein
MKKNRSIEGTGEETPHLGLDCAQDALDNSNKSFQDWNDAMAREEAGTVEGYIKGHSEIVLRICIRSEQLDFVFRAVPERILRGLDAARLEDHTQTIKTQEDRSNQRMLVTPPVMIHST